VHRRYRRRLADAAVGGRRVVIVLRVRLLVCQDRGCSVRRFAEQVAGLTAPRARRSSGLRAALEAIGLALAGRAAVRLAARLGLSASRTTACSYASCQLARVAAARVTHTASSAPPIGAVWRRWWASGVAQHRHHVVEELKPGAGGGRLGQQRRRPAQLAQQLHPRPVRRRAFTFKAGGPGRGQPGRPGPTQYRVGQRGLAQPGDVPVPGSSCCVPRGLRR